MPALTVSEEIRHLIRDKGYSQERAVAAALNMQREGKISKAKYETLVSEIRNMFEKSCEYPHLSKGAGGCPYAKSCGCPGHKKAGYSPPGFDSRMPGSVRKSEAVDPLDLVKGLGTQEQIDELVKGPPAGFQPIPGGRHGGYRRRRGGKFEYWYPEGHPSRPKGTAGTVRSSKKGGTAAAVHREDIGEYNLSIVAGGDGKLTAKDVARAKEIAQKMREGIAAAADVCKMSPPVCAGNMGIPREQMPQIMEKPIGAMLRSGDPDEVKRARAAIAVGADPKETRSPQQILLERLKARGVTIERTEVAVGELKATQRDIKAGKTFGMADAYLKGKFRPQDAEIVISSDGHILDGHHRYAALITATPDVKMKVQRIGVPMREFLEESFKTPGVFREDLQGNIVDPSVPHDLSGGSTKKSLMLWAQLHPEEARAVLRKANAQGFAAPTTDPLDLVKARPAEPPAFHIGSVHFSNNEAAELNKGGEVRRHARPRPADPELVSFGGPDPYNVNRNAHGVLTHPNGTDRRG